MVYVTNQYTCITNVTFFFLFMYWLWYPTLWAFTLIYKGSSSQRCDKTFAHLSSKTKGQTFWYFKVEKEESIQLGQTFLLSSPPLDVTEIIFRVFCGNFKMYWSYLFTIFGTNSLTWLFELNDKGCRIHSVK